MKNRFLYGLHHGQAQAIVDILQTDLKDVPLNILHKAPNILKYNVLEFQTLMRMFKKYEITAEMVQKCPSIFVLKPDEFLRRVEYVLKNQFTLIYHRHPKFLTLVKLYYVILPRVRYLEEKKLKYATIYSLTTFHNYLEQLVSSRSVVASGSFFVEMLDDRVDFFLQVDFYEASDHQGFAMFVRDEIRQRRRGIGAARQETPLLHVRAIGSDVRDDGLSEETFHQGRSL